MTVQSAEGILQMPVEKDTENVHHEFAEPKAQRLPGIEDGQAIHRLTRKIDWKLMPLMCSTYALQYYDKVILGHAAIYGLKEDLGLDRDPLAFSNASMIFYCGYAAGAFPISYLSQTYSTGKVCAITVAIWSVIVLSTAGCMNYRTLLVNRFFLGFVESGVAPSFMLVVSMWYTKRDQLFRSGLWYSFSGGANMVVPVISWGIAHIPSARLNTWQYMYLIMGAATLAWSIVIFLFFPDSPDTVSWLLPEEKALIQARMQEDNAGHIDWTFKWRHIVEAVTSLSFWCFNLMAMLTSVTSGPISSFGSIIFQQMGFSSSQSLLMNMPNGLMAFLCILISAALGRRLSGSCLYLICIGSVLVVLGCALVWQLPSSNTAGRLAGFYVMNFFSFAYVQVLGLGTANVGGYTKKATYSAGIFISYCVGSIIGPLLFNDDDAPRYNPGFMAVMICLAACFAISLLLRLHLAGENKRRDAVYGPPGVERGLEDITDKENTDFRFLL